MSVIKYLKLLVDCWLMVWDEIFKGRMHVHQDTVAHNTFSARV